MALRFRIQVNAKPEDVFAYVADLGRHGEWANPKAGLKVEPVSGGETMVGSKFRSSQKFFNSNTGAEITVTELRAPSTLAFEAVQKGKKRDTSYTNTFTFTPAGGGTLVERSLNAKPASPIALIAYPAIRADAMTALRRLKAHFEGSA
jgi:uncharacterized protein YndB with AHSA1/START domain